MPNTYVNKVQLADGTSLIDISDTTATVSDVLNSKYFYNASGQKVQGTATGGGTAAISVVDTLDTAGGTVRTITALDISDTTATASDVASGKYFYTAAGVKTAGTATGGTIVMSDVANATGTTLSVTADSQTTAHSIYFEFTDSTNTTIPVFYNDSLLGTIITAYTPTTYNNKTVSLAQLDGVTWYEYNPVPIGVELVNYNTLSSNTSINSQGAAETTEWYYATDYIAIEDDMSFTYTASWWHYIGFYDESKTALGTVYVYSDGTVDPDDQNTGHGTLNSSKIPTGSKYVRLCGTWYNDEAISLIRTA